MTTKKTPKRPWLSLGELLALDLPTPKAILTPWLNECESALLYAPTGAGKSMVALSVGLAVAGGGSFLGWRAPEPRRVLYVDAEMAPVTLQERTKMLLPALDGLDRTAATRNLSIYARQHLGSGNDFPDLSTEEGQDAIFKILNTIKPALVIFDNLSGLTSMEDENSATAFGPLNAYFRKLKAAGFALLLVHHTGKLQSGPRGSSRLVESFDVALGLKRAKTGGALAVETEWTKTRHKVDASMVGQCVRFTEEGGVGRWDAGTFGNEACGSALTGAKWTRTLLALQTGQFRTASALADYLGINKSTVGHHLNAAEKAGALSATDRAGYLLGKQPPDPY